MKPSILDPCPRCGGTYGLVNHSREECDKAVLQRGRVFTLKQSDVLKCAHVIMVPEHYRPDGTCRCNDPTHREMYEWGYYWTGERWAVDHSRM